MKLEQQVVKKLCRTIEFIFQWIRIFNVYDKTGKTGNDNWSCQLRKSLDKEEKYFNMTFGEKKSDFIEINKACLLIKKIIFQNQINGIINCCSGKPRTILNLVRQCLKEWKKNIVLNVGYYEYREFEPDNFHGSTTKLNEIIKVYNENF